MRAVIFWRIPMTMFPVLRVESIVQVNDKTRLDATAAFSSEADEIVKVEIRPSNTDSFIDVTTDKFLDHQYPSSGTMTVTLKLTDATPTSITFTKEIKVVSENIDRLFSADEDLIKYEPDVMTFLRDGKSSFKDIHREAQSRVLRKLEEMNLKNSQGGWLTKENIFDKEEVRDWAKFIALKIVSYGISKQVDDFYWKKGDKYEAMEKVARERSIITLDTNADGVADSNQSLRSFDLRRE